MKRPSVTGSVREKQLIEKAFLWLAADTLKSNSTGKPWALQFVSDYVKEIRCQELKHYGRAIDNGIVLIDCKLDDPDHCVYDIAGKLVHEANHQYWSKVKGTTKNSKEEEDDCRKEEADFLDRVGKPSEHIRRNIG